MKYATFGIDSNPLYAFFAPLTALVWNALGYRALVIVIEGSTSPATQLVHRELEGLPCDIVRLLPPAGHLTATVAQIARIYAWSAAVVQDNDYVLTTDADMWPLAPAWFERGECQPSGFSLLYANNRTRFPMCYLGGHKAIWHEIIGAGGTFQERVDHHLSVHLGPGGHPSDAWQHDEEFVTGRIHAWSGFPARCMCVDRASGEPPADRIDRADWPRSFDLTQRIDAHLLRPGYTVDNWPHLEKLFYALCPAHEAWAAVYHRMFIQVLEA
jgi:hypothetical protein